MTLFDTDLAPSRHTDPPSSRAGARAANTAGERETIVRALTEHPDGLTADELTAYLPCHRSQICSRLALLARAGRVERTGIERQNDRGSFVTVWAVS